MAATDATHSSSSSSLFLRLHPLIFITHSVFYSLLLFFLSYFFFFSVQLWERWSIVLHVTSYHRPSVRPGADELAYVATTPSPTPSWISGCFFLSFLSHIFFLIFIEKYKSIDYQTEWQKELRDHVVVKAIFFLPFNSFFFRCGWSSRLFAWSFRASVPIRQAFDHLLLSSTYIFSPFFFLLFMHFILAFHFPLCACLLYGWPWRWTFPHRGEAHGCTKVQQQKRRSSRDQCNEFSSSLLFLLGYRLVSLVATTAREVVE